ncbi:MAG TPA: tetratricopeptide repeat protein [Terriglobales bacterium]|jgi:tetratricopeptide (TPR) repeat protein|nr:tetratricopeptide repeat protein [Terriglobales bacterium]
MKRITRLLASWFIFLSAISYAQIDKIVIPAGTPEDLTLTEIGKEQDGQKRTSMYQDFLQKFSSNPAAVAYGNWQLAQTYQNSGDLAKALEYGDKAVAGSPHNLDILVSQASIAQQMKNDAKIVEYSTRGGEAYNSIAKQTRPEGMSDQDFAARVAEDRNSAKNGYDFLEAAGFNAIADEKDPKARMSYIERYTAAYPESKYADQVAQYAMYTLGPGQLNDPARLVKFGDKALASNPNSIPALLLLSNFYVDDTKPGSVTKAASYAQKVIELAKADAPDADKSRKLSSGVAHSTLGYALMKQDKTAAAIPQFKSALELLKGQDDTAYAAALYRLGYAYAKTNKVSDARDVLEQAVKIEGPVQQPAQELLTKVNAARAKAK